MTKKTIKNIVIIILGLVLWYSTVKVMDTTDLGKINPNILISIVFVWHLFLKPFFLFMFIWVFFKPRYMSQVFGLCMLFYFILCILALITSLIEPSFESVSRCISFLFSAILFRIVGGTMANKEIMTISSPPDVGFKYYFLFPFYKPKRYREIVIEKAKPITFLKGYIVILVLFFIVELIMTSIKIILRNFIG